MIPTGNSFMTQNITSFFKNLLFDIGVMFNRIGQVRLAAQRRQYANKGRRVRRVWPDVPHCPPCQIELLNVTDRGFGLLSLCLVRRSVIRSVENRHSYVRYNVTACHVSTMSCALRF